MKTRRNQYNPLASYPVRVGLLCREERQRQKLTTEHIAKATGIDKSMVSRFERGEKHSYWLLLYYVLFLGVDLGAVFNYEYDMGDLIINGKD